MFTIISKESILTQFHQAIKGKLSDIVMVYPEFQQKVEERILWGIFSKEFIYSSPEKQYGNYTPLTSLSYNVVELAKQELIKIGEKQTEFFLPEVDSFFKEKDINVYVDYEDCDVKIESVERISQDVKEDSKLLIVSTLPDSYIVFESLISGSLFDNGNKWLYEYMDKYDEWKNEVMSDFHRHLLQIGGHGSWIQNNYNKTYMAQLNIDICDSGSVFIEVMDKEARGCIDMY